jgi:hypothetical protein
MVTAVKMKPLVRCLIGVCEAILRDPNPKRLQYLRDWCEVAEKILADRTDYEMPEYRE